MKDAQDVIPWKVTDISIRPYDGYWSFNPSIHFDGETWRCVLRCCDYAMPDGVTIRSKSARTGQQTKNAMVVFDPTSWEPIQIFRMREKDNLPREACPHVGFEDMRLFRTDKGGLQGIAAALHLKRDREPRAAAAAGGRAQHQPPEQVLLSFDANYDIVDAHPIRGDGWSGTPQKNWVPFDHCVEPRFLYSIDKGTMFGDRGPLHGEEASVRPSMIEARESPASSETTAPSVPPAATSPSPTAQEQEEAHKRHREEKAAKKSARPPMVRGGDMRIVRGGRIKLDAMTSRPSSKPSARSSSRPPMARSSDDSMRLMGSGRMLLPKYEGLRGGTQLARVADSAWLGVGHQMKFVNGRKYYWHVWYLVDAHGKMTAASPPMKLAPGGIEFAAGIAIDGDRVIVSFGVDDMECRLGETKLSAVMEMLQPVER
jgi:hypothetical protein